MRLVRLPNMGFSGKDGKQELPCHAPIVHARSGPKRVREDLQQPSYGTPVLVNGGRNRRGGRGVQAGQVAKWLPAAAAAACQNN